MWKFCSIFTSDTESILIKALHMGEIYSYVSTIENLLQNYGNANIFNLINSSYIKADNSTIFNWLKNNTGFFSKIAATHANFKRKTLLIPETAFPDNVH